MNSQTLKFTKPETLAIIGLLLFFSSYIMFAQNGQVAFLRTPIDFAHWFNLIGASLLFAFNFIFPKNKINTLATILTTLGVVAHIGLCTIDILFWSMGTDEAFKQQVSEIISSTPSLIYPFVIIGPSLLFVGLSVHAAQFIKVHPIKYTLVTIGAVMTGYSFFILKDGFYMVISCLAFVAGLFLLIVDMKSRRIME